MQDYKKLVKALRLCQFGECGCGKCYYKELKGDWCTEDNHPEFFDCDDKLKLDAADAIEALNRLLDQTTQRCEALRKQLREAHESYENHLNELEAEVKRLQDKLCDWCAVCPKERRKPEDCEMLSETPVMYGPSDAVNVEVQE